MFNNQFRYLLIFLLGIYSYFNTAFTEIFFHYKIEGPKLLIAAAFVFICFFVWESSRLLQQLILSRSQRKGARIHPLIILFALSIPFAFLSGLFVFYSVNTLILKNPFDKDEIALKLCIVFSLRVNLFLHCINTIAFYLDQFKQKKLEAEELRVISSQAELQAIKSQINPHFLFNNLNVLSTLVLQKNEEASRFIEEFSSVYRYILTNHNKEMVTVQKELDFIEPYLFLLHKRFGEGLKVDINVPEKYHSFSIVPVALQMLLENSIKHNIVSTSKPLKIKIFIDDDNLLVVSNNLQLKESFLESTQWGLNNINQRIKLSSNKEIIIIKTAFDFSVSIPIIENEF